MNAQQFGSGVEFVANAVKAGLGGHGAAALINPAMEDMYWREQYKNEAYVDQSYTYDDYGPAYSVGYNGRSRYIDRFAEAETVLSRDWEATKGKSRLSWQEARLAALAAWIRIDTAQSNVEEKMAA